MFGALGHLTPMQLMLWAAWGVAQWRIAPPVSRTRPANVVVPAESAAESRAYEPY
jgi:hypothetical protein